MPKPPKTQTTPKGLEIPIPARDEVYAALAEIAKDAKPRAFHFVSNRAANGLPEGSEYFHWREDCPLIVVFVSEQAERREGPGQFGPCPNCRLLTTAECPAAGP